MLHINNIHSLSDFQRQTKDHLLRLKESGEPQVLTIHGKAELVVQDAGAYQRLLDELALARSNLAIATSLKHARQGEGSDALTAIAELRSELNLPPAGS